VKSDDLPPSMRLGCQATGSLTTQSHSKSAMATSPACRPTPYCRPFSLGRVDRHPSHIDDNAYPRSRCQMSRLPFVPNVQLAQPGLDHGQPPWPDRDKRPDTLDG
jgi:hypothetical protein